MISLANITHWPFIRGYYKWSLLYYRCVIRYNGQPVIVAKEIMPQNPH